MTEHNQAPEASDATRDASRSLRAFLAHMRHELRTPLNHIIGYCELLLEDEGTYPESFVLDLHQIHAAGKRLLALVNNLLDPTKVEAVNTDSDLETLGSQIHHEVRTPLNHIIGYTELLLEESADPSLAGVSADLQKIHAAGKQLFALIDDILHLSKIQASQGDLSVETPNVSAMIQDVVTTIRSLTEDSDRAADAERGTVLVVDDNATNRDLLARRLEQEGHTVTVAETGRQALELLRAQSFDLVLLDIIMPEMNGYQVLERLKSDSAWRHVPVIMLSSLDEIDAAVRCIEIGADDYLPRPFNPVLLKARIGACLEKKRLRDREVLYLQQIEQEKQRYEELLHVILPHEIVEELRRNNKVQPRRHENVAVLFCDIVGFTPYCEGHPPEEVILHLQQLVETCEEIAHRYSLEKIKTIGDSFMATAGLLTPAENPVLNAVKCGLEMAPAAPRLEAGWRVRVGIHVGPVIAGVVGNRKYLFDLWGDTVNTAARVESHGANGAVNVSGTAWQQIANLCDGESLGFVQVKGKGEMEIFQVTGLKRET